MYLRLSTASTALALAVCTSLLLPAQLALADDGPVGSDLRGAMYIWIVCGAFVIIAALAMFWAWRTGQFSGDPEDAKYRMLDVEDPDDLALTQWQPKTKRRRLRRPGPRSA